MSDDKSNSNPQLHFKFVIMKSKLNFSWCSSFLEFVKNMRKNKQTQYILLKFNTIVPTYQNNWTIPYPNHKSEL